MQYLMHSQNADTDWVVWVDADTFVHNNFPYEAWDNFLPR